MFEIDKICEFEKNRMLNICFFGPLRKYSFSESIFCVHVLNNHYVSASRDNHGFIPVCYKSVFPDLLHIIEQLHG